MRVWVGTRTAGSLRDEADARVSVLDHGFTVADGVFETMKVTADGPFALTRHLRRLTASAAAIGLPAPDDATVRRAVTDVLAGRPVDGRLRITYTAGRAPLGSERGAESPTLVVACAPTRPWPATPPAITVPWTRNERSPLTGVKSTSYGENVVALARAHAAGVSEAVFANTRGDLCEGTGTNVFVVVAGRVLTPTLGSGCLPGITRELVLDWFGAVEADLPLRVLAEADEVFLTSSTRDVHPVVRIDGRTWPCGGPVSTRLRAEFAARAADDIDP